ncbi:MULTISPECIES: DNA-binding protein [Avibacterium]|uniref:DNA-binding protein n=1 Tax=Avibacterium TaxID=292486 RepID=UPI0022484352|nr:DNA-binding protein [Avibacterium sp. 21-594]MCW9716074.1 type II toxin-antitoxin system RelE/ParE family toxin [Avibacterium sp. 21-594]
MYTIIEQESFKKKADQLWSEEERATFFSFLANNPLIGDVIPNANGLRKIRWRALGRGKRGGLRIIYFNLLDDGIIVMLDMYAKNEKENISTKELNTLQRGKK